MKFQVEVRPSTDNSLFIGWQNEAVDVEAYVERDGAIRVVVESSTCSDEYVTPENERLSELVAIALAALTKLIIQKDKP